MTGATLAWLVMIDGDIEAGATNARHRYGKEGAGRLRTRKGDTQLGPTCVRED